MELSVVLVIIGFICVVILSFYLHFKKKANDKAMNNIIHTRRILDRSRRIRRSGGFYPIGYTGGYLEGEAMVDEIYWMAMLENMSDVDRADLGEYGEYGEPADEEVPVDRFDPPPPPVEEQPEATEFEHITVEPDPEPVRNVAVNDSNGGWGGGDDSDNSGGWGGSDDSGGWDTDD